MEQSVRETLEAMIEPTLNEDGNVGYALHQGLEDPTVFYMYEGWASRDALKSNMGQPYFHKMDDGLRDTLENPYEVTLVRKIGGAVPIEAEHIAP
jgi:quinol monooxygenase YgiN